MFLNPLSALFRFAHLLWRAALAALDRWTDPPIMRKRINAGSDVYFAWRERHEGDSEVDEILGLGDDVEIDDD